MSTGSRLPLPSFPRKHVLSRVEGRESRPYVTPVKTGVHPRPLNLDTGFRRYDGL